ncbi:MAG TPA: hypothetical protein ENK96_01210, partial [Desulfobulbaceae bacterium]|nr:hypothetical protein [Desulfobulbaceae bacterium]
MKRLNTIGILLCVLLFVAGFFIKGNVGMYFNIAGFMIVVGGSAAAALLSFRLDRLLITFKVVKASYSHRFKSESEIVDILIDLAIKSKVQGVLSLQDEEQETSILFLRRGLGNRGESMLEEEAPCDLLQKIIRHDLNMGNHSKLRSY